MTSTYKLSFKQAQTVLLLINRYIKYAFFVILGVCLFDLDLWPWERSQLDLKLDLKQVYAVAYLDEKKDETCILN